MSAFLMSLIEPMILSIVNIGINWYNKNKLEEYKLKVVTAQEMLKSAQESIIKEKEIQKKVDAITEEKVAPTIIKKEVTISDSTTGKVLAVTTPDKVEEKVAEIKAVNPTMEVKKEESVGLNFDDFNAGK